MDDNRIIYRSQLDNLTDAARYYEKLAGVSLDGLKPKIQAKVNDAQKLVIEQCNIVMVYKRVPIVSHGETETILEGGHTLSGSLPAKVLEKADELYAYVIILEGFNDIKHDNVMIEIFADTWASAYVENAQAKFAAFLQDKLAAENKLRTHLWSPGQHTFELQNQIVLFDILKPEDIACTLSEHLMMVPVKACSGIIGIVPSDTQDFPKPCDYCQFKSSCPSSEKGCAAL